MDKPVKDIDDYDMYDLDFNEWWRRGLESFGMDTSIVDKETEPVL